MGLSNNIITGHEGAIMTAERGDYVVPLEGLTKKPLFKNWRDECTNDPERVKKWHLDAQNPNYGIVMDKSDKLGLDEDTLGEVERFAKDHGHTLPPTYTVATGREGGGQHLVFDAQGVEYNDSPRFRRDGYDIDVRFKAFIRGPGSIHKTGVIYAVVDDRVPVPVPGWLHEYLTAPFSTTSEPLEGIEGTSAPSASPEYARAVKEGALADLAAAAALPEGAIDAKGRGWESGALLAPLCRLVEASNTIGDEYPLEDAHADFMALDPGGFARLFEHKWDGAVQRAGDKKLRPSNPADDFAQPLTQETTTDTKTAGFKLLNWTELLAGPPPEPDWVLWPLAERGQSVSLYSVPKVGKSLLMLDMLWRAAAGQKVLGQPAKDPIRVLYIDAENTRNDLSKRLHDMGADPAQLAGLMYASFPSIGQLDTKTGAAKLLEMVDDLDPDLVVIDTISRFIEGAENDADTWLKVYREALEPLKSREVAVIRLDHSGKDVERGERGSSAKNGDVDVSWQLTYNKAHQTRTLTQKFTRTGNGPDRLVLNVQDDPLRHEAATEFDPDPVADLAEKLEELNADPDIGRRLSATLLRENGHSFSDKNLREALSQRKARGGAK